MKIQLKRAVVGQELPTTPTETEIQKAAQCVQSGNRFLVVSQPRSGGTLLLRLLNQCTTLSMGGERPFNMIAGITMGMKSLNSAHWFNPLDPRQQFKLRPMDDDMDVCDIKTAEYHNYFASNYCTPCDFVNMKISMIAALRCMMGGNHSGGFKTNALFLENTLAITLEFLKIVKEAMPQTKFVWLKRDMPDIEKSLIECKPRWEHMYPTIQNLMYVLEQQRENITWWAETNEVDVLHYEHLVANPIECLRYFSAGVNEDKVKEVLAKKLK